MSRDLDLGTTPPRPAAPSPAGRAIIPRWLYSMKFAIWIVVALAVASVGGVLIEQFYPVRSEIEAQQLAERLPGPALKAFYLLQLQDPFRAHWFRSLLGALALSLTICSLRRVRSALRQAFRLHAIREPRALAMLQNSTAVHHVEPEIFDRVVRRLRRGFYGGIVERGPDSRVAALHRGGLARIGPVLLHLGILVLVLAGLVASIVGKKFFLEIAPGETVPIAGSRYALRVDDFQIDKNDAGMIKQYRSRVTLLENDVERAEREITVNHPLRYAGYDVYQASYRSDPRRASSMVFAVQPQSPADPASVLHPDAPAASPATNAPTIQADMRGTYPVPGYPGYAFRVVRFFGHLVIGSDGATNAGADFSNPAAQVQVLRDGQPAGSQWAFLRFPAMHRSALPFVLEMRAAEPAFVTGLEINTNPGTPLVWLGFTLSTLGLVLSFLVQHRSFYVLAKPAERGWTLWIAGRSDRERVTFTQDFEKLVHAVREDARRAVVPTRGATTRPRELESLSGQALLTPYV